MFGKEFYPTPNELVKQMIKDIDFKMITSVLEPSAGKGDIVDAVKERWEQVDYYGHKTHDIDTIEIDDSLAMILKGKGYRVVYNDFLTYNTFKKYDLIIMNPPFSNGDKHLLKAIDIQKDGGAIICLLNAETIKNPYSNERKVLIKKLNDYNANIEYIENAFINAENKTCVEIALAKILIPEKEKESYIFEQLRNEEKYKKQYQSSEYQLIKDDLVEEIVNQYQIEVKAGISLINEYNAMKPHILRDFDEKNHWNAPILKLELDDKEQLTINNYVCKTRYKYWTALFNNPKFTDKLTSNLRAEYSNRISELQNYDFSIYNIYQIKCEMSKNMVKGVENTIIKLFDELSYQFNYSDELSKNIHYYNGWKTNKAWYINKKVIIPYMNAFNSYWDNKFEPRYEVLSKLRDIEKSLNYLDGSRTLDIDLESTLKLAEIDGRTSKIPLKYFNVTFYKKGTCHIEFTNLELLKKFNIYGCQQKGWLPPSYGKETYSDMDHEEKEVINEFEGKDSYEETFIKKDYYIVNSNELLQLT